MFQVSSISETGVAVKSPALLFLLLFFSMVFLFFHSSRLVSNCPVPVSHLAPYPAAISSSARQPISARPVSSATPSAYVVEYYSLLGKYIVVGTRLKIPRA